MSLIRPDLMTNQKRGGPKVLLWKDELRVRLLINIIFSADETHLLLIDIF